MLTAGILPVPGTNRFAELEGENSVLPLENPDLGGVGCAVCLALREAGCF